MAITSKTKVKCKVKVNVATPPKQLKWCAENEIKINGEKM